MMLVYWGRRGPISRWMLDIARAVGRTLPADMCMLSVAEQNEMFPAIRAETTNLLPVSTFTSNRDAVLRLDRCFVARRRLVQEVETRKIPAVVTLMPHLWTPLVTPVLRRAGVRTVTIVHDASPHPGDPTARLTPWLVRDARLADRVVTLSRHVADDLVSRGISPQKITTLFHPSTGLDAPLAPLRSPSEGPLRLLFLGRLLPYKGLPLALEALELLASEGFRFSLTVAGDGDISDLEGRLDAMNARVLNAWLSDADIAELCASHDAMLLPYTSASQSGVAGLALAAGLPMLGTPVGGLKEQIEHGVTGLLAEKADAVEFAAVLRRVATEPEVLATLRAGILDRRTALSMPAFLKSLEDVALR